MKMALQLSFEENSNSEDIQVLGNGIREYAKQQRGLNPLDFFAFFIRDEANTIRGGCNECTPLWFSVYRSTLGK
jgi:hypothetical protein